MQTTPSSQSVEPLMIRYRVSAPKSVLFHSRYDPQRSLNVIDSAGDDGKDTPVVSSGFSVLKTAQAAGGED